MPPTWSHSDEWTMDGNKFGVQIRRHTKYEGKNGWCVYAVVRKGHPLFPRLDVSLDDDYYNIPAIGELPLHGGCTYFDRMVHKGILWAFKIGCDYSHYGDERFEERSTRESAASVFYDAEELFRVLLAMEVAT